MGDLGNLQSDDWKWKELDHENDDHVGYNSLRDIVLNMYNAIEQIEAEINRFKIGSGCLKF